MEIKQEEFPLLQSSRHVDHHDFFQEEIISIYFQLQRTSNYNQIISLYNKVNNLFSLLKTRCSNFSSYIHLLLAMIAQTRDVLHGKGEHHITYLMILALYNYEPRYSLFMLYRLVQPLVLYMPYYGGWRDIKYFCEFVKDYSKEKENHPLIFYAIELANDQLYKDWYTYKFSVNCFSKKHISNVCKWIPREHKKFNWLHTKMATQWARIHKPYLFNNVITSYQHIKVQNKCKKIYRKVYSFLNKELETTEVHLCKQSYDKINPQNVGLQTFASNYDIFLDNEKDNLNNKLVDDLIKRGIESEDEQLFNSTIDLAVEKIIKKVIKSQIDNIDNSSREDKSEAEKNKSIMATKFDTYFYELFSKKSDHFIYFHDYQHVNHISLFYFVKHAVEAHKTNNIIKMDFLDNLWNKSMFLLHERYRDYFIPIVDVSLTMQLNNSEQFYYSLGLAILLSKYSYIPDRIIAMDSQPIWVSWDENASFCKKISCFMEQIKYGQKTKANFESVLDLISYNCIKTEMSNYFVKQIHMVFFSGSFEELKQSFFSKVNFMFSNYTKLPKITFWNTSNQGMKNMIPVHNNSTYLYMSGYSNSIMKQFIKTNKKSLNKPTNAYDFIKQMIQIPHYELFFEYSL